MAETIHNADMKKLLFIYNPNAGKGRIKDHLDNILEIFKDAGYDTELYETKAPLDAQKKAEDSGSCYDLVVCFGGDGTLNETVSGIMKLDKKPPVGFIPAGSTNDTAKSFDLPKNIEDAARVAVTGRPYKTDVGSLGDRYFIYVASFGDISDVSAFTPSEAKKKLGHAAYIVEGMKVLPKMKYHCIKAELDDGTVIEGEYYLGMITNSFQVGGFHGITGHSVDLADGLFEVLLLAKPRNIIDLEKQIEAVLIKQDDESVDVKYGKLPDGDEGYEIVSRFKASNIVFSSPEDIQWVTDGEDAGCHKHISLKNHHQAVEIMIK